MLKKIFLLAVFGAVFMARGQIPVAQEAYDIGEDFDKAETWQQKGADFVAAHKRNYFRFLDKDKQDAANAIRQGNVKFYGLEVYETRIWFARGRWPSREARAMRGAKEPQVRYSTAYPTRAERMLRWEPKTTVAPGRVTR